jgi:hypothetical protein
LKPHAPSFCTRQANPAPSARVGSRPGARLAKCITGLVLGLAVAGCTRVLELPIPRMLSSPSGPSIDVAPVTDERNTRKLGKLDTLMIESGPELASYLEAELINGLGAADSRLAKSMRTHHRPASSVWERRCSRPSSRRRALC